MKKLYLNDIAFSQISKRIETLRSTKDKAIVRDGWINYMRNALGLTLTDLSKLLSLTPANIAQAEKREVEGKVSLSTLRKIAEAMECELVYSFVPKKEIKTLLFEKAYEKARKTLQHANLHMALEDQKVTGEENESIERLAKKLIARGDIW